jgi:hypothetical protein
MFFIITERRKRMRGRNGEGEKDKRQKTKDKRNKATRFKELRDAVPRSGSG